MLYTAIDFVRVQPTDFPVVQLTDFPRAQSTDLFQSPLDCCLKTRLSYQHLLSIATKYSTELLEPFLLVHRQ